MIRKKKRLAGKQRAVWEGFLAATYSPTGNPLQYHRPRRASRPSSGWDRVLLLRRHHQERGGMGASKMCDSRSGVQSACRDAMRRTLVFGKGKGGQAARPISTGQLRALLRVHTRPITSWSTRGLEEPKLGE